MEDPNHSKPDWVSRIHVKARKTTFQAYLCAYVFYLPRPWRKAWSRSSWRCGPSTSRAPRKSTCGGTSWQGAPLSEEINQSKRDMWKKKRFSIAYHLSTCDSRKRQRGAHGTATLPSTHAGSTNPTTRWSPPSPKALMRCSSIPVSLLFLELSKEHQSGSETSQSVHVSGVGDKWNQNRNHVVDVDDIIWYMGKAVSWNAILPTLGLYAGDLLRIRCWPS